MRNALLWLEIAVGVLGAVSLAACSESQAGEPWPEATGFFQVAEVGERWWLITPEGELF